MKEHMYLNFAPNMTSWLQPPHWKSARRFLLVAMAVSQLHPGMLPAAQALVMVCATPAAVDACRKPASLVPES